MREPPRVMPLVRQVDCACSRPLWPYSVRSLDQDLVAQGRQSFLNAVERATSLICPILTDRGRLADMRTLRGFGNFVLDWMAIQYRTIREYIINQMGCGLGLTFSATAGAKTPFFCS